MKVLVIGDSYGLPRFAKNSVQVELSYRECYPEKLRLLLCDIFKTDIPLLNRSRHANVSLSLVKGEANEVVFLEPDYVVLQLGLVDLWPGTGRNVEPLYQELAGHDPWVDAEAYTANICRFAEFAATRRAKVLIVNIPPVAAELCVRYPAIADRIEQYNRRLEALAATCEAVTLIDWYAIAAGQEPQKVLGSDGIHPTAWASELLARQLVAAIVKLEQE